MHCRRKGWRKGGVRMILMSTPRGQDLRVRLPGVGVRVVVAHNPPRRARLAVGESVILTENDSDDSKIVYIIFCYYHVDLQAMTFNDSQ